MKLPAQTYPLQSPAAPLFDLVVIGAGIAGLNALAAAADLLPKDARVALVDANARPGGMWTWIYDHCHLHQPHTAFTVGNMPWNWRRPADYLASRGEVARHLERCYKNLRTRLRVEEHFGQYAQSCQPEGDHQLVRLCLAADGPASELRARRVVWATGYNVPRSAPLSLSSRAVDSVASEDLITALHSRPAAPVYVVGGGKTGMDAIHRIVSGDDRRPVTLIDGTGTTFMRREMLFPKSPRRWWTGVLVADFFRDIALRFDGTNEDAIHDRIAQHYGTAVGAGRRFLFGLLSDAERDTIAGGLSEVIGDHLEDVVDGPEGPEMILRSGAHRPVEPGALIVGCTGQLMRHPRPQAPCLSADGQVLRIVPNATTHFLSTTAAFLMTHAFLSDRMSRMPLYEMDGDALFARSPQAYVAAIAALTYANTIALIETLPARTMMRCGTDLDSVFPIYRRLRALLGIKRYGARRTAWCRAALDEVARRHGVRCGPLRPGVPEDETVRRTRAA
ncbi:FAD-dependent oxidoreductase [Roseovarius indicus]|uniref:Pyridine nucleotide-disulfide oxidoreductase n=1 Tax=Roseovarius indicus TaxID=540747 RepID=A0A5P3AC18_9RHOB|nr:FAD-dependent oxidoreductase [Roseovarius indicus]QEW25835.1 Pyridine nucleotide-disulfide oxidoreductase [Roseovarius indicus]SFD89066.1 Pyridine nucleotide-disulphide oxidoreductase [Roseovarius indicus]